MSESASPDGESRRTADQLVELVRRYLPDWNSVGDPRFAGEEIDYKRRAAEKTAELLAEDELRQLAAREQFGEILDRLKKVARATNLLYLGTPSSGDLAVLHADNMEPRSFTEAVLDLLYGDGDSPDRLERFSTYLDERSLPNKWTFPTYLLFFRFPEAEMFVKPRATRWLLDLARAEIDLGSRPTADAYREILALVHHLLTELEPFGARDLIDVQSVLFVAYQVSRHMKQLRPSDAKRREMERLFEDFVRQYLDTEEGREHMASYPRARQEARRSFDAIRAAREADEDVTDRVLLELLPHADNQGNRDQGAWIHIAPAITGDLKKWFEANGWRNPDDWDEVADAVFHFVERVTAKPAELAEACREFDALPWSTGLQAGMLSPALNALQPDEFLLANSKPRLIINYLAGKKLSPKLVEYPEVNWTGKILIEHLADLLETGVAAGEGGYRIEDVFDTFTHWLVAIRHFPVSRHWKVAPGEGARYWDDWLEGGHMSIGWNDLGDLSRLSREEFEQKRDEMVEADEDMKPDRLEQVWKFAHEIREGDKIVANQGTGKVLGFGTVSGRYEFLPDEDDHGHRRPVDWDDTAPRDVEEKGWRRTLVALDRDKFEKLVDLPVDGNDDRPDPPPAGVNPKLPVPDLANALNTDPQEVERWVRAVERKRQVIFYGPPGTGKTYAAEHLADHLVGGGTGFTELIQFHPSYAYEDFMQGIRPEPHPEGGLSYPIRPGRFLNFCQRARRCDGTCVLILDEVNRANLSRVFGELIYLLENRGKQISLAAGGERFSIPENVRIIGTMNTADRSIALVDHALRRRFAFLRLGPDYEVLRRFHEKSDFDPESLVELLTEVNQAIDDPHYELGITFFLLPDLEGQLADVWSLEIVPYLEEYFADRPDQVERFRWPNVQARLLP